MRPERLAIVDGDLLVTYGELWAEADRIAHQLTKLGIRERQGIGVLAPNGAGFIAAALAASSLGAVVMPLYHRLAVDELHEIVEGSGLHGVIDCRGERDRNIAAEGGGATWKTAFGAMRFRRLPRDPNTPWIAHIPDAAFVRFTSGTTSAARGIVIGHRGMCERLDVARRGLGIGDGDRALWVMPMAFHFFVSILLYLDLGASIVIAPDLLASDMIEAARSGRATFIYASPMHYRLLASDASGLNMPDLRLAVSVSSALDPAIAAAFRERFGVPVTQALGIIEVGLPLVNRADPLGRPAAVGRPTEGCEIRILDAQGNPARAGQIGEIALRCPGMLAGWLDPPLTRDKILRDGWFFPGDLARRDPDGVIALVGRSKLAINVAGHKVFPEEVAAVLERHPAVARASIGSRPHPLLGEAVHANIELVAGAVAPTLEALRAHCRPFLSAHKLPVSIEIGEVELTPSGKTLHGIIA